MRNPRSCDILLTFRTIMPSSLESWRRIPTARDALFGPELPYLPPKNPTVAFLWRRRIWLETTFGLSVLEPWEKLFLCAYFMLHLITNLTTLLSPVAVFYILLILVLTGILKYFPLQLVHFQNRMVYYFVGEQSQGGAVLHHVVLGLFKSTNSTSKF